MKRRELREHMQRMAETLNLRWAPRLARFVGVHRGVIVDLSEWGGEAALRFVCPGPNLVMGVEEALDCFHACREAGVPREWLRPVGESEGESVAHLGGLDFRIDLDSDRLDELGAETFRRIPDLVVTDLHSLGAGESLPCATCGQHPASAVGLVDFSYTPLCAPCWQDLQSTARRGRLATSQQVDWRLVAPILLAGTVLGGLLWGLLQQPEQLERFTIPMALAPAGWALLLCWAAGRFAGGVTRLLRAALFTSVIVSVLAGNIWGYRAFLLQQAGLRGLLEPPGLVDSVQAYFSILPTHFSGEAPFLIGGVLGAWIGLRFMKHRESVAVE